ncbi:GspH/FimT family pseudopilin [Dyella sp. 20L07]|uniref:GspH/FimT family pseudopilin n=1 Tax=Dyella sp. 20L07 TaxID=3384240 RepID=UPI003D2CE8D8
MQSLPQWRGGQPTRVSATDESGFTLVELMITLAIAVVLVAIAVPSFRNITLSNRLTTTTNDVVAALNTARMEAIKRNGNVQFCSNSSSANKADTSLGTQCGTSAGAVTAITGAGKAQTVRDAVAGIAAPLQIKGDIKALRFNGQGLGALPGSSAPYDGQIIDICTDSLSTDNHRTISIKAGWALKVDVGNGACAS